MFEYLYFISGFQYILLLKMCLVLNGPYLLDYASPGTKPYICELALNLLSMPINFVLGQNGIQVVTRYDSKGSPNFSLGEVASLVATYI